MRTEGGISYSPRSLSVCLCVATNMAVGLSVGLRNYFGSCGVFFLGGGRRKFIHTLASQAAPRVGPKFPLFLWIRVRRDMLARVVAVSGHRGPGALKPLRPSSRQAPFKGLKPAVGVAGPVAVAVDT